MIYFGTDICYVFLLLLLLLLLLEGGVPTIKFQKLNTSISIFFSSRYDTV